MATFSAQAAADWSYAITVIKFDLCRVQRKKDMNEWITYIDLRTAVS